MDIGLFISNLFRTPFICLGWIIVGLLAGAIARSLMRSRSTSLIWDLLLGLAGAFVGGLIANLLDFTRPDGGLGLLLVNLVIAIVGAIILIAIGRLVMRRSVV